MWPSFHMCDPSVHMCDFWSLHVPHFGVRTSLIMGLARSSFRGSRVAHCGFGTSLMCVTDEVRACLHVPHFMSMTSHVSYVRPSLHIYAPHFISVTLIFFIFFCSSHVPHFICVTSLIWYVRLSFPMCNVPHFKCAFQMCFICVTHISYMWPSFFMCGHQSTCVTLISYVWPSFHTCDPHFVYVTQISYGWPRFHACDFRGSHVPDITHMCNVITHMCNVITHMCNVWHYTYV